MPELAEVETVARYLQTRIIGKQIETVRLLRNKLRYEIADNFSDFIETANIIEVTRRAKFLIINLDNDNSIIYHLGMSGRLTIQLKNYEHVKHDHIILNFSDQTQLVFNDTRRFGMVYTCPTDKILEQQFMKNMGIEPLSSSFTANYLFTTLARKTTSIKTAIMDSRIVVGIGNIYAAESLFLAGIHPLHQSNKLDYKKVKKLSVAIKQVLNNAIKDGGTTLKDFINGDGTPGYFKQKLAVYGRSGANCIKCNHKIEKIKQAGRSSFYCSNCQEQDC